MTDIPVKQEHYRDRLISKSHLTSMAFCPLQYKKIYVDKTVQQEDNFAMTVGTRFHEFADKFIQVAPEYRPADWEMFIHDDFTDYEKRMLQWFVSVERRRLVALDCDLEQWKPVFCEKTVLNEELGIGGTIDRLDKFGSGYCIVEYKTSKSIYKQSLQKEFGFYKYLLSKDPVYKDYPVVMGMVINPRVQQIELMKPSYESTILRMIQKCQDIRNGGDVKPTCTESKMAICSCKCSIEDSQLYKPKSTEDLNTDSQNI